MSIRQQDYRDISVIRAPLHLSMYSHMEKVCPPKSDPYNLNRQEEMLPEL